MVSSELESRIAEKVTAERVRLEQLAGLEPELVEHFRRFDQKPFTKDERDQTIILFNGFTASHDTIVEGIFRGLGYACQALPTPQKSAFEIGKEFCDNAMCNPTYFTVGNLIEYLQQLEAAGLGKREIIDKYIFFTAGSCGPCRFGMYEAEYRLGLQNAGFEGFRVILFQQTGGINQQDGSDGLEMNERFFLNLINAFNAGDIVNEMAYQIRPYEVEAGKTDAVLQGVRGYLQDVFKNGARGESTPSKNGVAVNEPGATSKSGFLRVFREQMSRKDYTRAFKEAGRRFEALEVDHLRVKPIVKITGEFWAQITEGDGNFKMFRFLEGEGAEVIVEPVATWVLYLIHQARQRLWDSKGLYDGLKPPGWWRIDKRLAAYGQYLKQLGLIMVTEKLYRREYYRLQRELSTTLHPLANQLEYEELAHKFYNSRARGGEGHLEVAKNIYYHNNDLCHMVLSLKPFGCMPSTQSDGIQVAVIERVSDMIYLPIETSGEGEINALSRVQMALGNARAKAKLEFQTVLAQTGQDLESLRAFVAEHRVLRSPLYPIPHTKGVVGRAANFALHLAALIDGRAQFLVPAETIGRS